MDKSLLLKISAVNYNIARPFKLMIYIWKLGDKTFPIYKVVAVTISLNRLENTPNSK